MKPGIYHRAQIKLFGIASCLNEIPKLKNFNRKFKNLIFFCRMFNNCLSVHSDIIIFFFFYQFLTSSLKKKFPPFLLGLEAPRRQFQTNIFFQDGLTHLIIQVWVKSMSDHIWQVKNQGIIIISTQFTVQTVIF